MKALLSSLLILILTAAASAADEPVKVLEDYYRFSQQENLAAYYNVIDTQSMGPRELKTRQSLTRVLWQRFDTLDYQIEDLRIEKGADTAIAGYRLKASISGPDDSGQTARLDTDQKQVALLVLRDTAWKVALVSDVASFNANLQNIFLQQQLATVQQPEAHKPMSVDKNPATPPKTAEAPKVASATPGKAMAGSSTAASSTGDTARGYKLAAKWGSKGKGAGQFLTLTDVAVDGDGYVYVCDMSDRIQKFTPDGKLLKTYNSQSVKGKDGKFNRPFGVTVDGDGNLYVSDYSYSQIHKFDSEFKFLQRWPKMDYNVGIAADGAGNIYVVEKRKNRLRKFDPNGSQLTVLGAAENGADGLVDPNDVALDPKGNIFVVEQNKCRVQKFDPEGRPLAQWGTPGNKPGKFNRPHYLAVDRAGYVYVSDTGNYRVQKFDNNGNFICQFGKTGPKAELVGKPAGIAVDAAGNIYVVDRQNYQVKKYAPLN